VTNASGAVATHALTFGYSGEPGMMSGGAAAGDIDGDGWIDLFVLRGDALPPALLHNNGDGSFGEQALARGLAFSSPLGLANGAAFGDVDGDGALDLIVGGIEHVTVGEGTAPPRLFRNDGDGNFSEFTLISQLTSDRNVWSATFGDYDRDGDLDLALAHWAKASGGQGQLWQNNGAGVFSDVSASAQISTAALGAHGGVGAPATCVGDGGSVAPRHPGSFADQDYSFTPNFADINDDGWPDLLIAADFCTSRVFINDQDGTFSDATSDAIQDENGMGAALADYDNDGDLDWFVSSIIDSDGTVEGNWGVTGNKLYRNNGSGAFTQVAQSAGVDFGDWGWGACFADFNNDGALDLFHVNGMDLPPGMMEEQFWFDPSHLFIGNGDGTFNEENVVRGADDDGQGRGVACFDYDRDGDIDLYLNNHRGTGRLLRNDGGNQGAWLGVRLTREDGNRHGVGARIEVETGDGTQMRELSAGNHFLSSSPIEAHFGLGGASRATIRIRWPDGQLQEFREVLTNRWLTLKAETILDSGFE
jgi:hypothetical protein